jgi:hypothetical protein
MLLNDKVSVSVCDGCSNWRICKFSEDVKRAEAEYKQLRENANWPECVETMLGCKYKQHVTNWRSAEIPTSKQYEYNRLTYVNTGNPPFIYDEGSTCNTVE